MSLPILFGAIVAAGVVIDYGVKNTRAAFANQAASAPAGATPTTGTPGKGSVLASILPAGVTARLDRHDQGRDIQATPGAPILAPGGGTVIRNASDPAGFGVSYPIVHFDSGPWAGLDVYIGHVKSAVQAGERFAAGAVLGVTQHGSGVYVGNAAGLPGWAEIGLAPGGSPGPFGQPPPPGL